MRPYTKEFYNTQREGSHRSAKTVVPLILALVKPQSVVDVGCGLGTWLWVFKQFGVEDVIGIDGEHVDRAILEIPSEQFLAFDLTQPIKLDRQFDLVVSLEVAEHLPGECAEIFIKSLTKLGPIVLFSAAIPFQGGTDHLNEQWPDYWANHFRENDYQAIDCIRKQVWQDDQVEWWYAQNTLIFARKEYLREHILLKQELEKSCPPSPLSMVHPKKYLDLIRIQVARQDLAALVAPSKSFILVDQEQLRESMALGDSAIPFLERNGRYWGPPQDDATAIRELERLRQSGSNFIVFLWPAFWWLDYYKSFRHHLVSNFRCVLQNDRLVAFNLKSEDTVQGPLGSP
jgi:SAM-dependent methyltransferase